MESDLDNGEVRLNVLRHFMLANIPIYLEDKDFKKINTVKSAHKKLVQFNNLIVQINYKKCSLDKKRNV